MRHMGVAKHVLHKQGMSLHGRKAGMNHDLRYRGATGTGAVLICAL